MRPLNLLQRKIRLRIQRQSLERTIMIMEVERRGLGAQQTTLSGRLGERENLASAVSGFSRISIREHQE